MRPAPDTAREQIATLAGDLFSVSFLAYFAFVLLEDTIDGFVRFHMSLPFVLLMAIASGLFLMLFPAPSKEHARTRRPRLVAAFAIGIGAAVFFAARAVALGWPYLALAIAIGMVTSAGTFFASRTEIDTRPH